ncbi:MAG: FimB/Mfa2 family fimbrial subunit [Rikenellaceae bacterium]|jgi:hypothetical protein|nr:FimB/Mfa2 family fimbrial subunit [Rikenellaceae bacterium]
MKYSYLLLVISSLATGCIKDDIWNCPPKVNTTVYFSLEDYDGNDIFPTEVDRVELFVYDSEGMLASRSSISKGELNIFTGKRLYLDPGTYTVIVWANAVRSQIVVNEDIHWLDRTHNHAMTAVPAGGALDDGDPLWYAPKENGTPLTVVVPGQGEVEVTAELRHAHVKLDVTVEGYDLVSRSDATEPLRMEVTDLTSRYDFDMNAHGERVSYQGHAPYTGSAGGYNRMFNIPVFDRDTPIRILITDSNGEQIHPDIRLSELLNESIDVKKLRYMPVIVRFSEDIGDPATIRVEVTVDLPGWSEGAVSPEM